MNTDPVRLVIALSLGAYGIYDAALALTMTAAPPVTTMFVLFLVEAVLAIVAAYGVGRNQSWAAAAVLFLGVLVAVRWLYEGFILGIVAYLYALFAAVLAVGLALVIVAYLSGRWNVSVSRRGPTPVAP